MWRAKKREPMQQFEEDIEKLMKLDEKIMNHAVSSGGGIHRDLCREFADQYLLCRRRYADTGFDDFARRTFVSSWKEDTDRRMQSLSRMFMLFSENYLAALLSGTGECPEMDGIFEYMSAVAAQEREKMERRKK